MFTYLLSGIFNYDLLICDDAGPGYARSMQWDVMHLTSQTKIGHSVVIVDNRLQSAELDLAKKLISTYQQTIFFFRIVDPCAEGNQAHYYYNFLQKVSVFNNVYLLSTYQPKEIIITFKLLYAKRFFHLPYPYLKEKEVTGALKRMNRIVITGSINANIYPYRYSIWKKVTRSIPRFFLFSILKHPGYIDLSNKKQHSHSFIKDEYIKYLSRYRYMLVCPSRAGIELLKYNECVYAGCMPVGIAPDSYPDDIKQLFLKLKPETFLTDLYKIFVKKNSRDVVSVMRKFLRETRSPEILNRNLKEFIIENPILSSVSINSGLVK